MNLNEQQFSCRDIKISEKLDSFPKFQSEDLRCIKKLYVDNDDKIKEREHIEK